LGDFETIIIGYCKALENYFWLLEDFETVIIRHYYEFYKDKETV
jgi:hypothetical protein